jgi:hypothetical protein
MRERQAMKKRFDLDAQAVDSNARSITGQSPIFLAAAYGYGCIARLIGGSKS